MSARAGAQAARPAQHRHRTYQFERLEDRLYMAADNLLAVDPAVRMDVFTCDVVGISPPAPVAQPIASEELPEQFQSAAEFEAWLIEAAVAQWGNLFGQTTYNPYGYWDRGFQMFDTAFLFDDGPIVLRADMALNAAVAGNAALAFDAFTSSTNLQVEGVDEADLVETDGEYLYILSGNELVIVAAGIGDELRIASRIHLEDRPVGMYLAGDRLALVSTSYGAPGYDNSFGNVFLFGADVNYSNSYGRPTTTVTVLDVADRSAPTLVQKSQLDGQLVTSRVVDGELRLVLNNSINLPRPIARPVDGETTTAPVLGEGRLRALPINGVPMANLLMVDDDWNPVSGTQYVYETQQEYLARLKDEIFKSAMPGLRILDADGNVLDEQLLTEPTSIFRPESPNDRSLTTIATFDLSSNEAGPAATASVFTSSPAQVYATADSVFLFSDAQEWNYWSASSGPTTAIRKFDFDPEAHEIKFSARGKVEGTLLNQFAADEHDGYLRVVTSSSWNGGHNVFVLEQVGKQLKVVGSVEGIAPGEQLHSVRFMGDRAFFVTFQQIDPFFAVDLSDPAHPALMGELKIPG
ncbi:MAG: beta-propeller domain-containing protein, partial [Pirellulales bacterium]